MLLLVTVFKTFTFTILIEFLQQAYDKYIFKPSYRSEKLKFKKFKEFQRLLWPNSQARMVILIFNALSTSLYCETLIFLMNMFYYLKRRRYCFEISEPFVQQTSVKHLKWFRLRTENNKRTRQTTKRTTTHRYRQ